MDSLLWWVAKQEYSMFLANKSQETKQKLIDELAVWKQKLDTLDKLYQKNAEKLERQIELYGDVLISKEVFLARKAKILAEKNSIDNDAINYQAEIDRINSILNSEYQTNDDGSWKSLVDNYFIPMQIKQSDLLIELDNLPDERKYEVIHQYIKSVNVENIDTINKNIVVNLVNYIGLEKELEFKYKSRGKRDKAFTLYGSEIEGFTYFDRVKPRNQQSYKDRQEYFVNYQRQLREKRKEQ